MRCGHMIFTSEKDCIGVYTNHVKESNHLGNIVKLENIGWGFYACGKEQFITSQELEKIRLKIEEVKISKAGKCPHCDGGFIGDRCCRHCEGTNRITSTE